MITYFDTSALIPLLIQEPGTVKAIAVWQAATHCISSALSEVESFAALAAAERGGRLSGDERHTVEVSLNELLEGMTRILPSRELIRRASVLAQEESLRGYDAMHLATALSVAPSLCRRETPTVLASGDAALLAAARRHGFATVDTAASQSVE